MTDPGPSARPGPSPWQQATVVAIHDETARAKTFRLALARPAPHRAGQHFVVRLTAPDGYTAQRSYSVASAPGTGEEIELTVERLADGEVSGFLHEVVAVGDALEVRGPIGAFFAWDGDRPALLVGGGSGVVPLMAMLRLARSLATPPPVHLVVSVRTPADLLYADELTGPGRHDVTVVYTREAPPGSARPPGHLTADDLPGELGGDRSAGATAYVCGSSPFADAATDLLLAAGFGTERIRVERFGPT